MFLTLLIVGIIGLILMALPGFNHHAGLGAGHGLNLGAHAAGHSAISPPGAAGTHIAAHSHTVQQTGQNSVANNGAAAQQPFQISSLLPSVRGVFSMATLFGASGLIIGQIVPLNLLTTCLVSAIPAIAIEYLAVRPLWNWMFSFEGKSTTPIEKIVMQEAKAVTPFRNGKGVISVNHDGRIVQFSASLSTLQASMPVGVGDNLTIEEIDLSQQRVRVSIKTEVDPSVLK